MRNEELSGLTDRKEVMRNKKKKNEVSSFFFYL